LDCFDNAVLELPTVDDMKAEWVAGNRLCGSSFPRASRESLARGVSAARSSPGTSPNAKAESLWARFKPARFYGRRDAENTPLEAAKALAWRCFYAG
jgi:hypothetical protein